MSNKVADGAILEDVRILDMTDGLAGSVAAMLLAECGADVVKVELPDGRSRRHPYGYRTWDRSKRSVALDIATMYGTDRLDALLSGADVLIHELGPARASEVGLDDESLARRHPHLIVSSVLG